MRKFLIADDDTDDVDIFQEALSKVDPAIVCYSATDGREVLEKLNSNEFELPNIIFMDINMPEMDGWQCLTKLKSNERYKDIPVIMYSTSDDRRDAEVALKLGALCFYTKPTSFTQLQKVLALIATNLDGNILAAIKGYDGFEYHKIFACS